MKKIRNLTEAQFLKLFFAFLAAAFLAGAVCMPDRASMFSGLWRIIASPCKVSTNYFALGGFAATFLNMSLVTAIGLGLFVVFGGTPNSGSTLAVLLSAGFCSWGINVLNIWPTVLGVILYGLVKKQKLGSLVNAMLFSTGIAPLISELLLRYPNAEGAAFSLFGLVLALAAGLVIGFFVSAGLGHSPKVHKGMDLYSAAVPVGMTAFLLNAVLYKAPGVALPGATLEKAELVLGTNLFCLAFFAACVVLAAALGCTPREYWKLLSSREQVGSVSSKLGNAVFLMNAGIYGLFILAYYNAVGASFNGVTFGLIFCMLACCNSGSHPGNVWPIMAGYVLSSFLFRWLGAALGGEFALAINAQAVLVGLCFANGLSPIVDKYGWHWGLLAAALHYCMVTIVPSVHGGFCLYNGGFTAALVCLVLVPVLESLATEKQARLARKH